MLDHAWSDQDDLVTGYWGLAAQPHFQNRNLCQRCSAHAYRPLHPKGAVVQGPDQAQGPLYAMLLTQVVGISPHFPNTWHCHVRLTPVGCNLTDSMLLASLWPIGGRCPALGAGSVQVPMPTPVPLPVAQLNHDAWFWLALLVT